MPFQTDRLALPMLAAGQAQKEVTHNEALTLLDMLVQPVVQSASTMLPPTDAPPGRCWIVPTGASGAWSGKPGQIAGWTNAGWRFAEPSAGWQSYVADEAQWLCFDGTAWVQNQVRPQGFYVSGERVVGSRQAAIAAPTGGTVSDMEGRAAISAILAALRAHGIISL